jgi:hypothetical protein
MNSELPIWVQYIQAFSLPALAIIAAWIAYRQYRTAHDTLRLDLFERRLEVYTQARKFIHKVVQEGHPSHEDFGPLWRARDAANFLFESEIGDFLKRVNDLGAELMSSNRMIETAEGQARQAIIEKNGTQFREFEKLDDEISEKCSKYMRFSNIKI